MEENKNNQCFVIMPISDPEDYEPGHFKCVYEDILIPAIKEAGYTPKRADDDKSSSMIQVNIIQDIIESPMAVCDLSSRNPNVLFELGIRQAFDLPVVLVQEEGTPRIFDISTINTIDYRKTLLYRCVIEDRKKIKKEGIDDNALLYTMSNQIQSIMNKLYDLENISIKEGEIKMTQQEAISIKKNHIQKMVINAKDRVERALTVEEVKKALRDASTVRVAIRDSDVLSAKEKTLMLYELAEIDALANCRISEMREV